MVALGVGDGRQPGQQQHHVVKDPVPPRIGQRFVDAATLCLGKQGVPEPTPATRVHVGGLLHDAGPELRSVVRVTKEIRPSLCSMEMRKPPVHPRRDREHQIPKSNMQAGMLGAKVSPRLVPVRRVAVDDPQSARGPAAERGEVLKSSHHRAACDGAHVQQHWENGGVFLVARGLQQLPGQEPLGLEHKGQSDDVEVVFKVA